MKAVLGLMLLISLTTATAAASQQPFDFYVMSLSWSPQFCAIRPEDRQCGRNYGVVLHGLWPQYEKGYPQNCSQEKLPKKLQNNFEDLYPSKRLALHEWSKHGTCSGLTPGEYLTLSQTLKNSFKSPPALENMQQPLRVTPSEFKKQIIQANNALTDDALAFSCADGGRFLQEIYVCFNREGTAPIACSSELHRRSRKSCGQESFLIRSIR